MVTRPAVRSARSAVQPDAGLDAPRSSSHGLSLAHIEGDAVRVGFHGAELFSYVYAPHEEALESPKPFLHPMRSLAGELVSLYRPHDHIWHKGVYLGISNYGEHNVWGGPTYVRGEGYQWPANHGRITHQGFDRLELADGVVTVQERLRWEQADEPEAVPHFPPADERRTLTAEVWADARAWVLGFESALTNRSDRTVVLGSPTTKGRHMAGYGGLFWRGPRSFTGSCEVVAADGVGGDELMGVTGGWMAMRGRHDGAGRGSTLLFVDHGVDPRLPARWFVRVNPYACLGTAPFFDTEFDFASDDTIRLACSVVVAEGLLDPDQCAALAGRTGEGLRAAPA